MVLRALYTLLFMTMAAGIFAAPINDQFDGATLLGGNTSRTVDNSEASQQLCEPFIPGTFTDRRSVWYRYVASGNGNLRVDLTKSSTPAVAMVMTGNTLCDLTALPTSSNNNLSVCLTAGTTYYIWVDSTNGTGGTIRMDVTYAAPLGQVMGLGASKGTVDDLVRVNWTGLTGALRYRLYRSTFNNLSTATVIEENLTESPYDDGEVLPGTTYYYWIQAVGICGNGPVSLTSVSGLTGCEFSISSEETELPIAGGAGSYQLVSDGSCPWSAVLSDPWIDLISTDNGTGSSTIAFNVGANPGPGLREGTITINGLVHTISQPAPPCSYSLFPSSGVINFAGGNGQFNVTPSAECSWVAEAIPSWVTLTGATSGDGTGTVRYAVEENPNTTSRAGIIRIGSSDYTVNQSGAPPCSISPQTTTLEFPCDGGVVDLRINSNRSGCCYFIQKDAEASWVGGVPTEQLCGTQTIALTATPNTTGEPLVGQLTIAGRTVTLTQPVCDVVCLPEFARDSHSFNVLGGEDNVAFTLDVGCDWTAISSEGWLVVESIATTATGGRVNFSADVNDGELRSGFIIVQGEGFSERFEVVQSDFTTLVLEQILDLPIQSVINDRNNDGVVDAADLVEVAE